MFKKNIELDYRIVVYDCTGNTIETTLYTKGDFRKALKNYSKVKKFNHGAFVWA